MSKTRVPQNSGLIMVSSCFIYRTVCVGPEFLDELTNVCFWTLVMTGRKSSVLQQDESSLTIISLCRCTSVASRPETIMIQYLDILFYLVLFGGITCDFLAKICFKRDEKRCCTAHNSLCDARRCGAWRCGTSAGHLGFVGVNHPPPCWRSICSACWLPLVP